MENFTDLLVYSDYLRSKRQEIAAELISGQFCLDFKSQKLKTEFHGKFTGFLDTDNFGYGNDLYFLENHAVGQGYPRYRGFFGSSGKGHPVQNFDYGTGYGYHYLEDEDGEFRYYIFSEYNDRPDGICYGSYGSLEFEKVEAFGDGYLRCF